QRNIGLSNGNPGTSENEIKYALQVYAGYATVKESGVYRTETAFTPDVDVFRIAVVGGVVKYSKNGTVFYTSTILPTYPLLVDTSFAHMLGTINNVMISFPAPAGGPQPVTWTSAVYVSMTGNGNSLKKTGGCDGCADAGAISQQQIASGDGYVEFTASEPNTQRNI